MRLALATAAVVVACLLGGLLALSTYTAEKDIGAATVQLDTSPFHQGALDVYVPVVDWGARFSGVKLPARLTIGVHAVDRRLATGVAASGNAAARDLRAQARDAVASYLKTLAVLAALSAIAAGGIAIAMMRPQHWRVLIAVSCVCGFAWAAAIAVLLAPRGDLSRATYYAHGSDIPVALKLLENAQRTPGRLDEEIDSQLVGLARLVAAPGARVSLRGLPRLTVASDLHNNFTALPALRSAAAGGPVLFAGDLSDRGTPLETSLVRRAVHSGRPFVVVGGNHDSDTSLRALARAGAVVLNQRRGIVRVRGLRVAGYVSPNLRTAAGGYADRGAGISFAQQAAFDAWFDRIAPEVDVVMAHEPELVRPAIERSRIDPPDHPLVFVVGHTHHAGVTDDKGVTVVNGGSLGAGGTGNLTDPVPASLAVLTYARRFEPLAVDLVAASPSTGAATARRVRLDAG